MATPKMVKTDMPFPVFSTEADTDYILARIVHFLGGKFGSRAGFFGQQCCEKYMKALSVQHDGTYIETHSLLALATKCEVYGAYFSAAETKRVLEQFVCSIKSADTAGLPILIRYPKVALWEV
jgi:HEPN domain-containing protein